MCTRTRAATCEGHGRGHCGVIRGQEESGSGAGFAIIQPVCVRGLGLSVGRAIDEGALQASRGQDMTEREVGFATTLNQGVCEV